MADSKVQTTTEDINRIRIQNVCLELFSHISRTILRSHVTPSKVEAYRKCLQKKTFTKDEEKILREGSEENTFEKFDTSLVYKVIRNFSIAIPNLLNVDLPKDGWERKPSGVSTVGDAIKLMAQIRNESVHSDVIISDADFENTWVWFINICSFVDDEYKGNHFSERLEYYKTRFIMDDPTKELLRKAKEECRTIKRTLKFTVAVAAGLGTFAVYQQYRAYRRNSPPPDRRNSPPKFTNCKQPKQKTYTTERGKTTKVEWENVEAYDAEDGVIIPQRIGEPSGSSFGPGNHTIFYLATDSEELAKTCIINFEVKESSIKCEPPNMGRLLRSGKTKGMLEWDVASLYTSTDCVPPKIEQIDGMPSGSTFSVGSHNVVYKITDSKGVPVHCSFTFNVFDSASLQPETDISKCGHKVYGVQDDNYSKEIEKIVSEGEMIKQGIVLQDIEKQKTMQIATIVFSISPEMSFNFQKWNKQRNSSTPASPFSKWAWETKFPQCKPEDEPLKTEWTKQENEARKDNEDRGKEDFTSEKERIEQGKTLPEDDLRKSAEMISNVHLILPELSTYFQKWGKQCVQAPFPYRRIPVNRMPQCKPEDAPFPTVRDTGYRHGDQNYERVLAEISFKGEMIRKGAAALEIEQKNVAEVAARLHLILPKISKQFKKWSDQRQGSTKAYPPWSYTNTRQCKPEDEPFTSRQTKIDPKPQAFEGLKISTPESKDSHGDPIIFGGQTRDADDNKDEEEKKGKRKDENMEKVYWYDTEKQKRPDLKNDDEDAGDEEEDSRDISNKPREKGNTNDTKSPEDIKRNDRDNPYENPNDQKILNSTAKPMDNQGKKRMEISKPKATMPRKKEYTPKRKARGPSYYRAPECQTPYAALYHSYHQPTCPSLYPPNSPPLIGSQSTYPSACNSASQSGCILQ